MMVASLVPHTDFSPVPRIEVELAPLSVYDGGSASSTGPTVLDGGSAGVVGSVVDGGGAVVIPVSVPDGTDRVTVWRRCEGRAIKVRGAVQRNYSGSLGFQDMEAGFGATSSYEMECFAGTTSLGRVTIGEAVLPPLEGPSWRTLVQQPLNPNLWAIVEDVDIHVPEVERAAEGELVLPEGAAFPRLVGGGPRQGIREAEIVFASDTRDIAARVWATLGTPDYPQLQAWLIRSNHPLLPRVFFCSVGVLRERSFDIHTGGTKSRFLGNVTEIESPVPAVSIPLLRYSDLVAALGGTYSAIADALPLYSEWATAWEYAGAAG